MKYLLALVLVVASVQAFAEGKIKFTSSTSLGNTTLFLNPTFVLDNGEAASLYATADTAIGVCRILGFKTSTNHYYGSSDKNIVSLTAEGNLSGYYPGGTHYLAITNLICMK